MCFFFQNRFWFHDDNPLLNNWEICTQSLSHPIHRLNVFLRGELRSIPPPIILPPIAIIQKQYRIGLLQQPIHALITHQISRILWKKGLRTMVSRVLAQFRAPFYF